MNAQFEEALRCQTASGGMNTQTAPSTRSTNSSDTPVSDAAIRDGWPAFTDAVRSRLKVGAKAYGDGSFSLPAGRLAVEIEQEMFDVMGWGFILWCHVQELKAKLAALEAAASPTASPEGTVEPLGGDWRNPTSETFGLQRAQGASE